MTKERTLSIIKPDAIEKNRIGEIYARIESSGLRIAAAKMLMLSRETAAGFYCEHEGRPFYEPLLDFMTSGPVMVQVLEGDDAVNRYRLLMGKTNSPEADPGTIRKDFGTDNRKNAVHGSDGPQSASREIAFFFKPEEIFSQD